ncbi:MAG TPA: hypothetical protein VLY04_15055 [Bryobacteraceae bacterium]|nr:hypothetical protein [Bryobacteraceae bacterium]
MLRADSASVGWDSAKKQWSVQVKMGAEVIRRRLPKTPQSAAEDTLKNLAVQTAKDEGYDLDPSKVAVAH